MSFYDAFEARAEEYTMEKEAMSYKAPKGGLDWLRRKLNPTRAERLVDAAKGKVDATKKELGRKFDEAFPTRGMQMRRAAWEGTKAGLGAAARGTVAAGKGVASGAKALKQKLTPAPKLTRTQKFTAAVKNMPASAKAKFQSLPPKVKANWNKLSDTQKAVALGTGAAAVGAGATYAATKNRD